MRKANSKAGREAERRRDAEKFNKVVANLIERHWSDAVVEVFEERIGIPKPDILVTLDGAKIPIEVKHRSRRGYFYMTRRGGSYAICFKDRGEVVSVKNRSMYKREYFGHQVAAMLRDHGACLFLVNADVQPQTLIYGYARGGLVVLSNFVTFEQSLDMVYDFLKNPR